MKTKMLIATLGLILITGCASTLSSKANAPKETTTEEAVTQVHIPDNQQEVDTRTARRIQLRREIKDCTLEFMDMQAHVLDATDACMHIYGVGNPQAQRIKSLTQ